MLNSVSSFRALTIQVVSIYRTREEHSRLTHITIYSNDFLCWSNVTQLIFLCCPLVYLASYDTTWSGHIYGFSSAFFHVIHTVLQLVPVMKAMKVRLVLIMKKREV